LVVSAILFQPEFIADLGPKYPAFFHGYSVAETGVCQSGFSPDEVLFPVSLWESRDSLQAIPIAECSKSAWQSISI
jgi:hypothetical protein